MVDVSVYKFEPDQVAVYVDGERFDYGRDYMLGKMLVDLMNEETIDEASYSARYTFPRPIPKYEDDIGDDI